MYEGERTLGALLAARADASRTARSCASRRRPSPTGCSTRVPAGSRTRSSRSGSSPETGPRSCSATGPSTSGSGSGWLAPGIVEVPLNTGVRGDMLVHMLNTTGARTLVIDAQWLERVERIAPRLESLERVVVVGDGRVDAFDCVPYAALLDAPAERPPAVAMPRDASVILFTSGTTGPVEGRRAQPQRELPDRRQTTCRADGVRRRRGALQHVPALPRQCPLHERAAGDVDGPRRRASSTTASPPRASGTSAAQRASPPSTSWARSC